MPNCSNCQVALQSHGFVNLQMGESSVFFPNMSNIMAGSLELEMKTCPSCGKVEFYRGGSVSTPQGNVRCQNCGNVHDKSKCPRCQQGG